MGGLAGWLAWLGGLLAWLSGWVGGCLLACLGGCLGGCLGCGGSHVRVVAFFIPEQPSIYLSLSLSLSHTHTHTHTHTIGTQMNELHTHTVTGGEDASFVLPLDLGVFDGVGGE